MNPIKELNNLTNGQLQRLAADCLTIQDQYYNEVVSGKLDAHAAFYMMHGAFIAIKEQYRLPQTICPQP